MQNTLSETKSQDSLLVEAVGQDLLAIIEKTNSQLQKTNQAIEDIHTEHTRNKSRWSPQILTMPDHVVQRLNTLSKIKDREFRQFVTAIQTLRQMKAPPLTVNIKTNTAFVAGQQQNNF